MADLPVGQNMQSHVGTGEVKIQFLDSGILKAETFLKVKPSTKFEIPSRVLESFDVDILSNLRQYQAANKEGS